MEDSTPDFQDLLAAFDIPDMMVKISEVRSLAPVVTSAPISSTRAVTAGLPVMTTTVKQEPGPAVDNIQTSWQHIGQADSAVQQNEGLKALQMVASQLEGKGDTDMSQPGPAAAPTQEDSVESLLNGSASNGDSAGGFFKQLREAPSSAQHAKVVSSTLMANSWASVKSASTSPTISIASKPAKADKPPAMPTALIRYTKPISSAINALPPKFITTAITASVRVNLVNNNKQSKAPPLIIGSRAPQPIKMKTPSALVDVSDSKTLKVTNTSQPTIIVKTSTNTNTAVFPVQQLSSTDLLKRTNPIPKFVPPNYNQLKKTVLARGSNNSIKTRHTCTCEECGDVFLVQASLRLHMERRSVQIAFMCNFCFSRNRLVFYNKCSYYSHLRQHSKQMKLPINYKLQNKNATISSLTYAKPAQPIKFIITSEVVKAPKESETTKSNANPSPQLTSSAKVTESTTSSQNASNTSTAAIQKLDGNDCKMCGSKCASEFALRTHMHRYVQAQEMTCDHCKMILPNKCQLRAHSIMHVGAGKLWTCPECAKNFTSVKHFFNHVSNTCMHWYRQIRTRCKLCTKMVTDYEQHLDKGHEMLFYRCVSCSMAFKTLPTLKDHSERKHQVQPGSPLCRIISKCPFCETVFMQKPLLQSHIKMHIDQESKNKAWVYCCPNCSIKIGINLENFKKHMTLSHPSLKHFHCDFCRHNFSSYSQLKEHFQTGKLIKTDGPPGWICKVAKFCRSKTNDDSDNEDIETKSSETSDSPETSNDGKTEEQPLGKLYVKKTRSCLGCRKNGKTLYFFREDDLRQHMSKVHPEMKLSSLNSEECVKYVTIKPKQDEPKLTTKTVDEKSSAEEDSRKRKSSLADEKPMLKRPKFSLPTEFTCAKVQCLYQTSNRAEFKAHIELHCHDRSLSQCEECGICFRIESALKRHLFIQHSIREFDAYVRLVRGTSLSPTPDENSASPSPVQETTPHESPSTSSATSSAVVSDKSVPLECQVCYKTFQNVGNLRTHMRNHGMAFIRSKRSLSND